jgi:PAS domain S-box-containing protein
MPRAAAIENHTFHREALLWSAAGLALVLFALAFTQYFPVFGRQVAAHLTPAFLTIHLLMEFIAIWISAVIAAFAWHGKSRDETGSTNVLLLGFCIIAGLLLMHTLTVTGMPRFFGPSDTNRSTFFWLACRFVEVLVFVTLAQDVRFPLKRHTSLLLAALVVIGIAWLGSAQITRLPVLIGADKGVTPFKQAAEFTLCAAHAVAAGLLWHAAQQGAHSWYRLLAASALILGLSEFLITAYDRAPELFSLFTHLLEVLAYILVFRALSLAALKTPYERLQQSEGTLRQRESELRTMIDSLPFPAWVRDTEGRIILENMAYRTDWGDVGGTRPEDVEDPELRARIEETMRRALAGEVVEVDVEYALSGPSRTYHALAGPVRNAGRVTGVVGVAIDVTERDRIHRAAMESETLLRAFVKHVPADIAMLDTQTRIIHVSDEWIRNFHMEGRRVVGHTYAQLFPDFPPESTEHIRALAGEVIRFEQQEIRHSDRASDWVQLEMRPWLEPGGSIGGIMIFSLLITERVRAQLEVEKLNAELEKRVQDRTTQLSLANAELEEFSAAVSHDLRSPLRNIAGLVTMLQEEVASLDEEGRHYLAAVLREAGRAEQLVEDLLHLSGIGRAALNYQPVDLNQLVRELTDDVARNAGGRQIQWRIEPLAAVRADPGLLRQVLVNLISNAVKFTSGRDLAVIHIGVAPPELRPGECVIFVRDNGAGFDMQHAPRLFKAFQRLHAESEFTGTGIGLANVRRIVQRHGGAAWAESSPGEGACFYFSLPASDVLANTAPA